MTPPVLVVQRLTSKQHQQLDMFHEAVDGGDCSAQCSPITCTICQCKPCSQSWSVVRCAEMRLICDESTAAITYLSITTSISYRVLHRLPIALKTISRGRIDHFSRKTRQTNNKLFKCFMFGAARWW